uniref:Fatty acid-binding protein B n=1 Tax=Brachionus koreanus TaxID=1199090 RepID=A0AA49QEZ0_9BILA|nr:fatty acid-binding protein B [Brachionus koreanus]
MASLVGTWDLVDSQNWEEYLKEIGMGMIMRKAATSFKPTSIISRDGNKWTLKSVSTLKTTEITATEGVEFDEKTPDDRNVKSLIKIDGEKMIHEQRDKKGELVTVIVREVVDGKLVATITAGKVVCKRIYSRTA